MSKAQGQITIVDYDDALTLSSFIESNQVRTQMYNPDNESYIPDWSVSPFLVLTTSLYKAGSSSDIITSSDVKSVTYFEFIDGVETDIVASSTRIISGVNNQILTIKSNEMSSVNAKDYGVRIVYTDPTTGLDITQKATISFQKVQNGSGLVDAIANTPDGNIFKNNNTNTLIGTIDLWRGSEIDTTQVSYQWYMQDPTVLVDQGAGIGWRLLTDTVGRYTGCTTDTITIYAEAVDNVAVLKASVKDEDSSSSTYNTYFWDTISFMDVTDPIVVTITSTGGDVFKNGVGSSTLYAGVYQAGYEIDTAGTAYTYKWYKYDKDGVQDPDFGGTGIAYRRGKTIYVTVSDVDVKATFRVELD